MKNIYKLSLITAACISITLAGCYDLDRYPQDKLSLGTFWKTDEHAKQAIMSCYQAMKLSDVFNQVFSMDCLTDVATGYEATWDISRSVWTSSSGFVLSKWTNTYEGIARTNILLRYVDESATISENIKKEVMGEAYFLRALFYFHLLNHFGGVPIYDETWDYNNDFMKMTKPRETEEKVRELILGDLEKAINMLHVKWGTADHGRATKGAAYALRGKVYLYNKQYAEAIRDFEEIVLDPSSQGYGYSLFPNYANLFLPGGDESSEMIFSIQNMAGGVYSLGMPFVTYLGSMASIGISWQTYVVPSVRLADRYELKNGKPFNWNDFIPNFNEDNEVKKKTFIATLNETFTDIAEYPQYYDELMDMYEQRDPRMKQTLILPFTDYLGYVANAEKQCRFVMAQGVNTDNGFIVINRNYNTFLFRKFVPEGNMNGLITYNERDHVPINFPLIRYADVLLMLSECYNEQGDISNAVKYINMVRQRPSTNMPEINSGPTWLEARTKEAVFQRIFHERAVELAVEGSRYYDLKRWRLLKDMQNGYNEVDVLGSSIFVNKFQDKDYLWPIPLQEMDINPNLEPNPGW